MCQCSVQILFIVLTFHLHSCHKHGHGDHSLYHDDLHHSNIKVTRLKKQLPESGGLDNDSDPGSSTMGPNNQEDFEFDDQNREDVFDYSKNLTADITVDASRNSANNSSSLNPGVYIDLYSNNTDIYNVSTNLSESSLGSQESGYSSEQIIGDTPELENDNSAASILSKSAIENLFIKYGDGKSLTLEGLQRLLLNIGLHEVDSMEEISVDYVHNSFDNVHDSHDHDSPNHVHESHELSKDLDESHSVTNEDEKSTIPKTRLRRLIRHGSRAQPKQFTVNEEGRTNRRAQEDKSHDSDVSVSRIKRNSPTPVETQLNKCLSADDLFKSVKPDYHQNVDKVTANDFRLLCPILIEQLERSVCTESHVVFHKSAQSDVLDDRESNETGHFHDDTDHDCMNMTTSEGMTGLPNSAGKVWGYAILSCTVMSLVGLGSVAIIPIMHQVVYNHVLQFLVALAIGSLTGDAFLHLLPHAVQPHVPHSTDNGHSDHSNDNSGIWIGCVALGGIYFFLLTERIMGIILTRRRDINHKKHKARILANGTPREEETHLGSPLSGRDETRSCDDTLMVVHTDKGVCSMALEAHEEVHQNCAPEVRDDWNIGHGHGKSGLGHNHSHEVPGSVASVAWMVIMGDGLHNFCDGLAIGAAFASGLTSGLSTSVAVFCHELPHELGDFAVLLRAGMSVKKAMVYNLVSSVLCLLGMVVGITIGNLEAASQWIFAMIAGMFIYIALVDMLPEISRVTPKEGENPLVHLAIQNVGLLCGATIMLLIALYEDKILLPHWDP